MKVGKRRAWILAASLAGVPAVHAADWDHPNAASLGQGGIGCLTALERSPGAPAEPGWSFEFTAAELVWGSGIQDVSWSVRHFKSRWGWGTALAQLRSDVGRQSELDSALQFRWRCVRAGAGAGLRQASFEGYAPIRNATWRAGAGAAARPIRAALVLEDLSLRKGGEAPRLVLAAGADVSRSLAAALQFERRAARAPRSRAGLRWESSSLCLFAGEDLATASTSMGFGIAVGRLRFDWAATAHPDLGWSHVWTLGLTP